jgi:hypothetical protein
VYMKNTQLFQVVNERRESVQKGGQRCQPRDPNGASII